MHLQSNPNPNLNPSHYSNKHYHYQHFGIMSPSQSFVLYNMTKSQMTMIDLKGIKT